MRLSIIVAMAKNRAIGIDNNLIYYLPNDLKHFKNLTTGNTIIMGSNTFRSLPKGALPNRRNIVLSRKLNASDINGVEIFRSLNEALDYCRQLSAEGDATADEVFIIGGASVYQEALSLADRLCLTLIDDTPEAADTFFPEVNFDEWTEVSHESYSPDEKHSHAYSFVELVRKH
jgi:dihydrofolate reductase